MLRYVVLAALVAVAVGFPTSDNPNNDSSTEVPATEYPNNDSSTEVPATDTPNNDSSTEFPATDNPNNDSSTEFPATDNPNNDNSTESTTFETTTEVPEENVDTVPQLSGNTTYIPYQLILIVNETRRCDSSIISDEWLITSAHCVTNTISNYTIRLQPRSEDSNETAYSIDSVIVHENYWRDEIGIPYNDIAVLKVSPPMIFDETRQPVTLFNPDEESALASDDIIKDWGTIVENDIETSAVLQTISVPIISQRICQALYARLGELPYGQICIANPRDDERSCRGGVQSPLIIRNHLAGIASWRSGCDKPQFPRVFTEIAWYRDWIKENTGV